jgi:hypothetical protein
VVKRWWERIGLGERCRQPRTRRKRKQAQGSAPAGMPEYLGKDGYGRFERPMPLLCCLNAADKDSIFIERPHAL